MISKRVVDTEVLPRSGVGKYGAFVYNILVGIPPSAEHPGDSDSERLKEPIRMGIVKTAFEKAMERAAQIGELTEAEKEEMKGRERLKHLLAEFYKGHLKRDELWQQLRGVSPALLKEAQHAIIDSIRLGTPPEELAQKRDGLLALEALKEKQKTSAVEHMLRSIEKLQKEYDEQREAAIQELRNAIERNPQLRVRPVRTPDGRRVLQAAVSVDEAVQARTAEFLGEHEKRYEEMFNRLIDKFRSELR